MDNDSNLDNKSSIHSSLRNFTLKSILNIQKAIEHNKLVVFVGAGVSKNSGIPLWRELVQELAQELGLKSVANYSDGSDFWGGDDYLKIPQYYFNEREEKEYLDKIKEVLNRDVLPNEIHDIIFDLNPAHIVTTNYDNLLEKEYNIKQTDKRYEKVANDKELSSASMPNYIIKMHGEFDNIVLKECDYDSYSNNFKLMETYIKGLFATHTILFIGFGGSDPNIRRLIQWVKDIVGDKHQPAYLIDINNYEDVTAEEFRIKHEYYKKQGIFTLYKKQIQDDIEKIFINNQCKNKINLKDQGLDLYKFLYFIKNYKFYDVDKYYHKLKQLEPLKVINNKILEKVFNVKIIDRLFNHYSYPNESEQQKFELDTLRLKFVLAEPDNLDDNLDLLKFNTILKEEFKTKVNNINNLDTDINKKLLKELIAEIINFYPISIEEINKIKYIIGVINKAQKYENHVVAIRYLKYEYLNEELDSECNEYNIFAKAFDLYNMHKYVDAYNELSLISKKYQNNPIIYYIAEFNKKTVAGNLRWEFGYSKKLSKEAKQIAESFNTINLDNIIAHKIPESIRDIIKLFTMKNVKEEYFTFISIANNIKDYKTLINNGGSGTNNYCIDLVKNLISFFNYTIGNYIFINRYQETQTLFFHIIESIFESYTTVETEKKSFLNFGVHKIKTFDYFILFIICEFVSNKQFSNLLTRLKINKIELSNDKNTKKSLLDAFKNYLISIISCNGIRINDKIKNFFDIFGLINISIDEFKDIVFEYTKFINSYLPLSKEINSYNYRSSLHKNLATFIVNATNKFIEDKAKLPSELYEKVIDNYKDKITLFDDDYFRLIHNCIVALSNIRKYKFSNTNVINYYIENIDKIGCADSILADFYQIANSMDKKKIKKIFSSEKYKNITVSNVDIMYMLINNKIISFTKKIENSLFNAINSEIHFSRNDKLINLLRCLLNLILNHKIKNIDKIKELLNKLEDVSYSNDANITSFNDLLRLLKITSLCNHFDFSEMRLLDLIYLDNEFIKMIFENNPHLNDFIKLLIKNVDIQKYNQDNRRLIKERLDFIYSIINENTNIE